MAVIDLQTRANGYAISRRDKSVWARFVAVEVNGQSLERIQAMNIQYVIEVIRLHNIHPNLEISYAILIRDKARRDLRRDLLPSVEISNVLSSSCISSFL
jgi:hypothetical protein